MSKLTSPTPTSDEASSLDRLGGDSPVTGRRSKEERSWALGRTAQDREVQQREDDGENGHGGWGEQHRTGEDRTEEEKRKTLGDGCKMKSTALSITVKQTTASFYCGMFRHTFSCTHVVLCILLYCRGALSMPIIPSLLYRI